MRIIYFATTCLIFSVLALSYDYMYPRERAESYNNFQSSAYRGDGHTDVLGARDLAESILLDLPVWQAGFSIPEFANFITLEFQYHCEPVCEQLWLSMITKTGDPLRVLVEHPIFHQTRWLPMHENGIVMYQRHLQYKGLEDFFRNRTTEPLLMDSFLLADAPTEKAGIIALEHTFVAHEDLDTIITTYVPPRQNYNGWATFRRKLDIRQISRSPDGILPMSLESAYLDPEYKVFITMPQVVY